MTSIEGFKYRIAPFLHLWHSVVVRIGWMRLDGADRVLYLHAWLDCRNPRDIAPISECPSAGEFHATELILPIRKIKLVYEAISNGRLKLGRRMLLLQSCQQLGATVEWKGLNEANALYPSENVSEGFFVPRLSAGLGSIGRNQPPVVDLNQLSRLWTTSDAPFGGLADVMEEFFRFQRWTAGDEIFFCISAPVPIRFESQPEYSDGKLNGAVSIPMSADPKKVAIGAIVRFRDGTTRRQKWPMPVQHWHRFGDRQLCGFSHDSNAVRETQLILQYAGQVLFDRRYENLFTDAPNSRMLMHAVFDPEYRHLKESLAEPKLQKHDDILAERFERAVSWLLGFCGFSSFSYGKPKSLGAEVDVIAVSESKKIMITAECTVALPSNRDKLEKLFERTQRVRAAVGSVGYRVWPVIFTPVPRQIIPPTIGEMAAKNRIAIAGRETIDQLMMEASIGNKDGAIEIIRKLIGNSGQNFLPEYRDDWDRA